ncbi:UNVERIFIED_CONTAM: hypothetical protein Slati_4156500 [Sesamum latifolium]|uniref:Uncharacterized protein n=1 Tax=Sesamum latifolium TaxID=2727402 RepID=A0AAW2TCC6_9LAMI
MSTLQQLNDVDLESASSNNGGTADSGGGSGHRQVAAVSEGGGQHSPDESEIVQAAEVHGDNKRSTRGRSPVFQSVRWKLWIWKLGHLKPSYIWLQPRGTVGFAI